MSEKGSADAPNRFEEAMARVKAIVEEVEQGQVGLEASIDRYEEGMALIKRCREMLTAAEKRIEVITREAEGPGQASSEAADDS